MCYSLDSLIFAQIKRTYTSSCSSQAEQQRSDRNENGYVEQFIPLHTIYDKTEDLLNQLPNMKPTAFSGDLLAASPVSCHFKAWLRQTVLGWSSSVGHQALATDPECNRTASLQSSQVHSCHSSAVLLSLASCSCLQDMYLSCLPTKQQKLTIPFLSYVNGLEMVCTFSPSISVWPTILQDALKASVKTLHCPTPGWWNEVQKAESLAVLKCKQKTHLSVKHLSQH